MSANLQLYEQSAINFLQSCTVVFSPLAQQINTVLIAQGYTVDGTNPASFKYYMNLAGQYHAADTMMRIVSLDTQQLIDFTPAILAVHPKTLAAYTIGSPYYTALCQAYPQQTDLIKSILYPVDLQAAIAAADFTLLGWGSGYLEATEQDAIITELRSAIDYIVSRWYFPFLAREAYYTITFWGCFWQALPNAIFAARLKYLHTASAHSFHIWSYLQSNGIGDYSDILTSQQALFLYRNLRYLQQNKGKQSNLVILVNNLLNQLSVGLVGKTIYMNTATNAATCAWTPEFISTAVPTQNAQSLELIAPESMTAINTELVLAGCEVNSTTAYIDAQQTRIGLTPLNILPTKLLEIQKLGVDQKYGSVLNTFILDTLVWAITTGLYAPEVVVTDPTSKLVFSLSGKTALALYYYAVHRSGHEQPTVLPTVYSPSCAFRPNLSAASIPQQFQFHGQNYPTRSYLDTAMLLTGLGYPSQTVTDPTAFATLVADLFVVLLRYIRYSRTERSQISLEMLLAYCQNDLLQTTPYTFNLDTMSDYPTWITQHALAPLITSLDTQTDVVAAYTALANAISTALLPEDNPIYTFYAYTTADTDNLYDRLRALFVQLCSYNIAFLDTNRINPWWILTAPIVYAEQSHVLQQSQSYDPLLGVPELTPQLHVPVDAVALDREINVANTATNKLTVGGVETIRVCPNETRPIVNPLISAVYPTAVTHTIRIAACPLLTTTVIPPTIGVD